MYKPNPVVSFIAVMLGASIASAALAQADAAIRQKAEVCFACHGPNGNSQNPQYPVLAGQTWRYVYIQLKDFKEGRRTDPVMSPLAAQLERDDMIALGQFFAAQKPAPTGFKADGDKVAAGKKISDAVLCPMCHLGGFIGQNEIPKVAGQYPEYVRKQLHDFKERRRTNDAGNMTSVARSLSDEDIENLSHYIGNLN
jgi:cytochrome c553